MNGDLLAILTFVFGIGVLTGMFVRGALAWLFDWFLDVIRFKA